VKREGNWSGGLVIAAAITVVAFSAYLLATWPPDPPGSATLTVGDSPSSTSGTASAPDQDEATVVVLGDSFSAQSPASAGPEWTQLLGDSLGWEIITEAVEASGYVSRGEGKRFGGRVPDVLAHSPDVIIVAGGVGDLGTYSTDRIARAAENVVARLVKRAPAARIVVVSPFSNGEPGRLTEELSSSLEQIAEDHDVVYVDATDWLTRSRVFFDADPDHPNDRGQTAIANRMTQVLTEAGLAGAFADRPKS
jgi:lysophospholipase L1-like esterase